MLKVALGGALLVTATHGLALSLGGLQGSAIIGRPLDILVQGSIDAAEASSGLCLEADVIYGDVRLPASAITTAIQRLGADGKGAVRVRASTPVNEPIVTVALRAGCPTSFTRSYTVLADFEAAASAPLRESTTSTPAAVAQPKPVRAAEPSTVSRKAPPVKREGEARAAPTFNKPNSADEQKVATPVRLHAPRPRPAGVIRLTSKLKPVVVQAKPDENKRADAGAVAPVEQKAATTAAAGPRLKLDPIDAAPNVAGGVGPANPAGDKPEATVADATTAIQPTPEAPKAPDDAVLQKELQSLRDEQQRMRLAMETMNRQLSEAQQSRYNNPFVYGLGGLALLLAGGLVWLARKRQQKSVGADASGDPWWTVSDLEADKRAEEVLGSADGVKGEFVSSSNGDRGDGDSEVPGLQVSEATESVFLETPVSKIEVSSLVDLWQHVAFFESLGQHAEAANALEAFVSQYPRGSEAPYLFWLKLAEQQDDDKAYARAQGLYEQHFHRLVPSSTGGAGEYLEGDASFMLQLSSAWKEGKAQGLIERALVSQPGEPGGALQVRTAQSFDDLLVLHGVLETLNSLGTEPAQPASSQEWLSVSQITAVPATQQAAPVAVANASSTPSSADAGNMLDFQLPDIEPVAQTGGEPESAEPKKELPALDFEFQDFKTPSKPE